MDLPTIKAYLKFLRFLMPLFGHKAYILLTFAVAVVV